MPDAPHKGTRWTTSDIIRSVSPFVPAVRTVVVRVAIMQDGEVDSVFVPVVSGAIVVREKWVKRVPVNTYPDVPSPVPQDNFDSNWAYGETEAQVEWVYYDHSFPCWSIDTASEEGGNFEDLVVACPWSPEEDKERLAPTVAELVKNIKARMRQAAIVASDSRSEVQQERA